METSLLAVWAAAEPTSASLSRPARSAIAVAESVILPKPDKKLRRGLVLSTVMAFSPWTVIDEASFVVRRTRAAGKRMHHFGAPALRRRLHPNRCLRGMGAGRRSLMGEIFSFGRGIALLRTATIVSPRRELAPGPTFDPLSLLLAET